MRDQYSRVLAEFGIDRPGVELRRFGQGHIHDTFKISSDSKGSASYLLQKINQKVFSNVPELMANSLLVTNHLKKAMSTPANKKHRFLFPRYKITHGGRLYFQNDDGDCWRMCQFIPHAPGMPQSPAAVEAVGKAFGAFLFYLRKLSPENISETLSGFHSLPPRLEAFQLAVLENNCGRLRTCQSEVEQLQERGEDMLMVHRVAAAGEIPRRVTHNDTKMDNVLFDKDGSAIAIIDLDTVMPGLVHYDFGDAIRTCANLGAEDAPDLSTVEFDLTRFEAFARGYLGETGELLNQAEKGTLIEAPQLLTYLMAIRFLTDYLLDDIYYRTDFPLHNLVRTRVQLKLLKRIAPKKQKMQLILQSLCP